MDHDKRNEWLELLAKGDGEITAQAFLRNAKRESSAFHDDYTWDEKQAAKEYYDKTTINLIAKYSSLYNTMTADQRLYGVRPSMLPADKKKTKQVFRSAQLIAQNEDQLQEVRAAIWSRLRRVTRDMLDFKEYLPEFLDIAEYLLPKVKESEEVRETVKR